MKIVIKKISENEYYIERSRLFGLIKDYPWLCEGDEQGLFYDDLCGAMFDEMCVGPLIDCKVFVKKNYRKSIIVCNDTSGWPQKSIIYRMIGL